LPLFAYPTRFILSSYTIHCRKIVALSVGLIWHEGINRIMRGYFNCRNWCRLW